MSRGGDHDRHLDALERVLAAWPGTESFAHAVAETVGRHGFAAADVDAQLRHVVRRSRGSTMRLVRAAELGADALPAGAPERVLVLASGRMPGLAVEGIAAAFAVGAAALVRPSRDETVLHHVLATMREHEPELRERIDVVGLGSDPVPWVDADAAIVFGTDETVAMVRDLLRPEAARRVAGYGSRQAIAVVTPRVGSRADHGWAARIADDVLAFRQAGCMSPSWLFLVGSPEDAARAREAVGRELAGARGRHIAPGVDTALQQRRARNSDVLGAIAAGMSPASTALYAGDARLTLVHVPRIESLTAQVAALGSLLQTAVLAADPDEHEAIARSLRAAGVTRVCRPGEAHAPDPLWPQDGLGRVAPLLGGLPAGQ